MIETRFKDTEVGKIPEDWKIEYITSIVLPQKAAIKIGPFGSQLKKEFLKNSGIYKVYGQENVYSNDFEFCYRFLTEERFRNLQSCEIIPGDFLVSTMGTIGKCAVVPSDIGRGIMDSHLLRLRFNNNINKEWFAYFFASEITQKQISLLSVGGIMDGLSSKIIKKILVVRPTDKTEQKRIATSLSNIDALISELGKLIEKKRAIKLGAMQQLLTGKKRLNGFSTSAKYKRTIIGDIPEDWSISPISKLCSLKARIGWQGLTTDEYLSQGKYILITGTDFKDGYINWDSCNYVSKWRYEQDTNIQIKEGDVLITKDGTIGKVAYLKDVPKEGTLNSGVFVVRPKNNNVITKSYLSWLFKSVWFNDFINQLTAGSTINHLYQKDFVNFQLVYPENKKEQSAIALVLSTMDEEISALEAKRKKYTAIKKGMMQQLLTGKIRLI